MQCHCPRPSMPNELLQLLVGVCVGGWGMGVGQGGYRDDKMEPCKKGWTD